MKSIGSLIISILLLAGMAQSAELKQISPIKTMPSARDYTFMWWADGWRGRSPKGEFVRCVQTGHYGFAMDVEKVKILHMGPIAQPSTYEKAVSEDNSAIFAQPPADLKLWVEKDGKKYFCSQGAMNQQDLLDFPVRLVESGRYMQRGDIERLQFTDSEGHVLNAVGRFETAAFPDRLSLILDVKPTYDAPTLGTTFGRIGNGYCFGGKTFIDVPNSPELEPAQMTLETWVYLTANSNSWLICKNSNEFVEGNYGLLLSGNTPSAMMNIGGGQQNANVVSAPYGSLTLEKWQHLAMTYDGKKLCLYLDGALIGSKDVNKPRLPGNGGLRLGERQDGGGMAFTGILDEVRIHNRALTADEIKASATSPTLASKDPSVVREWSFDTAGEAPIKRGGEDWKAATLGISLDYNGKSYVNSTKTAAGDVWKLGEARTVGIGLLPGTNQATDEKGTSETVTAVDRLSTSVTLPVHYEEARGWYTVDMDALKNQSSMVPGVPREAQQDVLSRAKIRLSNPEAREKTLRLNFQLAGNFSVTGVSPMLRDLEGNPLGIPVQLSKDWHVTPGLKTPYQGPWLHGFTVFELPPKSSTEFECAIAFAHWGGVAAAAHAQLSLVGYSINQEWDQTSLGSWGESICYDPDVATGPCMICDVRPLMITGWGGDKWNWSNAVGGGDFMVYFDGNNKRQYLSRMKWAFTSQCPNLTDVTYSGITADGAIAAKIHIALPRTDDFVRGLYHIHYDVMKPTKFNRLAFFQLGADHYNNMAYAKIARGNVNGQLEEWETGPAEQKYQRQGIPIEMPVGWISMHKAMPAPDPNNKGGYGTRGIIVRSWDARLGGKATGPFASVYGEPPRAIVELSAPPQLTELQPGDYVDSDFEMTILPNRAQDYYGPNTALHDALEKYGDTAMMVEREAIGNNIQAKALAGKVTKAYPLSVQVDRRERASVEVIGGLGYLPITFTGLKDYRGYELWLTTNSGKTKVDQSVHGNDFWQTDYDYATKTWRITYNVPMDELRRMKQNVKFDFAKPK